MSTGRVIKEFKPTTSGDTSFLALTESKGMEFKAATSVDSNFFEKEESEGVDEDVDSHESEGEFESSKEEESDDFLYHNYKCDKHLHYKVIDLEVKQEDDEILDEEVKIKFGHISDHAIFRNCFDRLKRVKSLCIEAKGIDLFFYSAFRDFLKNNLFLQSVHIFVRQIKHDYEFLNVFKVYSSLESIYVEGFNKDRKGINDQCQQFILRNQQIRNFIKEAKNHIATIVSREDKNKEIKQEDERLIKLAVIYEKIWSLCSSGIIGQHDLIMLITDNDTGLADKMTRAKDFHPLVAAQKGKLDIVKKIFAVRQPDLEVNKVYYNYDGTNTPYRLIDLATKGDVIVYLVNEQKADATSFEVDKTKGRFDGRQLLSMEGANVLLRKCKGLLQLEPNLDLRTLNSFEDLFYDALAYTIIHCEPIFFAKILKDYFFEVDINLPIRCGIYEGYTLFQLTCLNYSALRVNQILFTLVDYFKKFSAEKRKNLLHSRFPLRKKYKNNSGLTVLQFLTYHLHVSFILNIIPDNIAFEEGNDLEIKDKKSEASFMREFNGYNLTQLFAQRVIDHSDNSEVSFDDIRKYYELLTRNKKQNLEGLCLRDHYDQSELPIFCYAMKYSQSRLAVDFSMNVLFNDFFSLDKRFECLGYKSITFLHMSVLFANDLFCKQLLMKILQSGKAQQSQIFNLLREMIDHNGKHRDCTLFQVSILENLGVFIDTCIQQGINFSSLINDPYPLDCFEYAGWTPIQVALQFVKKGDGRGDLFEILLKINGIDLSVCYPQGIYLMGLNVLQATVLSVRHDPYKYSQAGRNFSADCIRRLITKLEASAVNYACQDRESRFYGMTALHIAVEGQEEEYVQALLETDKTDYTITDSFRRTALEKARYLHHHDIVRQLEKGEKAYPQHKKRYLDGLKYWSEVCPSLSVTHDQWVVSIARENDSDHAFLIFEGLRSELKHEKPEAVIWIAQLYLPKSSYSIFGKAKVEIEPESEILKIGRGKTKNLLPLIKGKLKLALQLNSNTMLFYVSAYVESKRCQQMIESIRKEKPDTIKYSIFGTSKSRNCVTWAMEKYNRLVPKKNELRGDWANYFFGSARGFLNENFVYVADASTSRDLLSEQVSFLYKDNQRLLRNHRTLLSRQNFQWGLLFFILLNMLLNTIEQPASKVERLSYSFLFGVAAFFIFNSKFISPVEREYNEEYKKGNKFSLN